MATPGSETNYTTTGQNKKFTKPSLWCFDSVNMLCLSWCCADKGAVITPVTHDSLSVGRSKTVGCLFQITPIHLAGI